MVHLLSPFLGIVRTERVNWSELTGGPPDEDVLVAQRRWRRPLRLRNDRRGESGRR